MACVLQSGRLSATGSTGAQKMSWTPGRCMGGDVAKGEQLPLHKHNKPRRTCISCTTARRKLLPLGVSPSFLTRSAVSLSSGVKYAGRPRLRLPVCFHSIVVVHTKFKRWDGDFASANARCGLSVVPYTRWWDLLPLLTKIGCPTKRDLRK